jgi:hypothetical protein
LKKSIRKLSKDTELSVIRCGYCRSYLAPVVFSCGSNVEILALLCPHGHGGSRVTLGVIEADEARNSDV